MKALLMDSILKHTRSAKERIVELCSLLDSVPPTQCMKSECGDWCCTKLDSACDENGNFMSLPLIYTIEFYAIAQYIYDNFSVDEHARFFYADPKERKCVFRDNGGCLIYPVRPFSCRVYGREVPDIFWGIEYPPGSAASIHCRNCRINDEGMESDFLARYPKIWDKLYKLSHELPVVEPENKPFFSAVTGLDEIIILGWYERCELLAGSTGWFNKQFAAWWQTYSQLL